MRVMAGHHINEDWQEVPLPIYEVSDDYFVSCKEHGEFCPNAFYEKSEIAVMLAEQGFIDCPYCLQDIVGTGV